MPVALATGTITRVDGSYWTPASSHEASFIVMVEKQAEFVTGAGSAE